MLVLLLGGDLTAKLFNVDSNLRHSKSQRGKGPNGSARAQDNVQYDGILESNTLRKVIWKMS